MFDRTRLSRLITLALASCAVTWAFAAGAFARPDVTVASATPAPVYKAVAGDTDKAPSANRPPAYKAVAGDTDKAPSANRPPAYKAVVVDVNKTPDPAQVDKSLATLGRGVRANPNAPIVTNDDDTGTVALVTAILAMLLAVGAVTYVATRRPQPPVLRA